MSLKEYFQLAETKVTSARKVDTADATKAVVPGQCQLEVSTMDASWRHLLEPEFKKAYFIKVSLRPLESPLGGYSVLMGW